MYIFFISSYRAVYLMEIYLALLTINVHNLSALLISVGEGEVSSAGLKLERFTACSVRILAEKIMGE